MIRYDPDDDATKTPQRGYGAEHACRGLSCDHPDHWTECGAERCRGAVEGRPAIIPRGIPSGLCPACLGVPTCPACGVPTEPGGCDCYGIPTASPRYPSTADLAAFRHARVLAGLSSAGPLVGPMTARDYERAEGIGATGDAYKRARLDGVSIHARREAAALRSRAYERAFGSWQYAYNVARERGYDAGDWRPFIATDDDRAAHQVYVPR